MSYVRQVFIGAILHLFGTTHFSLLLTICYGLIYFESDISPGYKIIAGGLITIVIVPLLGLMVKLFAHNLKLREAQFEARTKAIEQRATEQSALVNQRSSAIESALIEQTKNLTNVLNDNMSQLRHERKAILEDHEKEQAGLTRTIVHSIEQLRNEQKELGTIFTTQIAAERNLNNRRHHNNMIVELAMMKQIKKLVPDCETLDEGMLLMPPLEDETR